MKLTRATTIKTTNTMVKSANENERENRDDKKSNIAKIEQIHQTT